MEGYVAMCFESGAYLQVYMFPLASVLRFDSAAGVVAFCLVGRHETDYSDFM